MSQQIVFFGSSPFSIVVLQKLLDAGRYALTAVVTTPNKPVGRHLKLTPNPVKVLAEKNNIPVYTSPLTPLQNFGEGNARGEVVGLVAAYGQLIKQGTLDKFNGQIYNIHPSLLPKYRGPSPLQQQILDGVIDTGVTIIQLDALMDHGPIAAVAPDKILPTDTTQTLGEKLFSKGADLFISLLNIEHWPLNIQDHSQATYTKKLTRQDGFVPWEEFNKLIIHPKSSLSLSLKFRALYPWPGVWSLTPNGERVKLIQLHPLQFLLENQSYPLSLEQLLSVNH